MIKKHEKQKNFLLFLITCIALVLLFLYSIRTGSISLSFSQLLHGMFVAYDPEVSSVYDLRFPRVIISMLAGACLATSGVLFQAVLKNPLADPGILGVSSGASFLATIATSLFPQFYFTAPLFSFLGGLLVFAFVYGLSWNGTLSPLRIILTGVAMQSLFSGLSSAFSSMTGGNYSGAASIIEGNVSMKTWQDVHILAVFACIGLILALFCRKWCNLCGLEDKTVRSLGINIDKVRLFLSLVGVFLVAGCTAIIGPVSFLGLLVPQIGRLLVGSDHKLLLPFSMLSGAILFLFADTLGRTIAYPYEISASVILAIAGGIAFVILLRKNGGLYGN